MHGEFICVLLLLIASFGYSQVIPIDCASPDAVASGKCCPQYNGAECGGPTRGRCQSVTKCNTYDEEPSGAPENFADNRFNWPMRVFTQVCQCNGNYGGVNCGECKFGYTENDGNCVKSSMNVRRSINSLTDAEWTQYTSDLMMAKNTNSTRYKVLIGNHTDADNFVSISVYNLFVWMHHYAARLNIDSEENGSAWDYAHESAGFLTWHRLYLMWFENEMRLLLNRPSFSLHYWDWTVEDNRETLFTDSRLGGHTSTGQVTGPFGSPTNWRPVCWLKNNAREICDPSNTDQVQPSIYRCPLNEECDKSSPNWPTIESAAEALSFDEYRGQKFNKYDNGSFSNSLEGFGRRPCDQTDQMCSPAEDSDMIQRELHNAVHIVLGIGHLQASGFETPGVMADVGASPNDPVFINHHTMIDCLFQQWLNETSPNLPDYPVVTSSFAGHGRTDCIVPFFPLYTNEEMYRSSEDFSYICDLPLITSGAVGSAFKISIVTCVVISILFSFLNIF